MSRKCPALVLFLVLGCLVAVGAENAMGPAADSRTAPASVLAAGVESFGAERYQDALDRFASILADPKASDLRPTAAYWTVLCYLALGDQAAAEKAIDSYLSAWPDGDRVPDLLYQKGRILHAKGNHEAALTAFSSFLSIAPGHSLVPSALYWGGECLYSLGRLEEADKVFKSLVDRYPSSVKVEAAAYRRNVIALEFRERELLRLLSISHEESIRAADDFRLRERKYEDALSVYGKQLDEARAALAAKPDTSAELSAKIGDLQTRLDLAQRNLEAAKAELDAARSQSATNADAAQAAIAAAKAEADRARVAAETAKAAAQAAATPKAPETPVVLPSAAQPTELVASALDAKKRALDLLAFYIDRLSQGGTK